MAEVLTNIEELRGRIDVIDEQLVRLLNVRVACAVEVGRLKHEAGLPIYQPEREAQVLAGVKRSATDLSGPLTADGTWKYRIVGVARDADTQVDFVKNDRYVLAPSLTYQPTTQTTLKRRTGWVRGGYD